MTHKSLPRHEKSGINERAEAVLPTPSPALEHSEPDKEVRQMSRCGKYNDSSSPFNPELYQNISELSAQYHAPINQEAEMLYRLMQAAKDLRPSIIVGLARCSKTDEQFLTCLKLAIFSHNYPEMSEAFAGEAIEAFSHDEARQADAAYDLVCLSACKEDSEWHDTKATVCGVFDVMGGK